MLRAVKKTEAEITKESMVTSLTVEQYCEKRGWKGEYLLICDRCAIIYEPSDLITVKMARDGSLSAHCPQKGKFGLKCGNRMNCDSPAYFDKEYHTKSL